MTYNFDEIIDRRNTNSENVEGWRPYICLLYTSLLSANNKEREKEWL